MLSSSAFRGLIFPTNVRPNSQGGLSLTGHDRQQIVFSVSYWDKLILPHDRFLKSGFEGEDTLVAQGIIETPLLDLEISGGFGSEIANAIIRAQLNLWQQLEAQNPGRWALGGQTEHQWLAGSDAVESGRGLLVEICKALPVPPADVSFEKILDFKEKRLLPRC